MVVIALVVAKNRSTAHDTTNCIVKVKCEMNAIVIFVRIPSTKKHIR